MFRRYSHIGFAAFVISMCVLPSHSIGKVQHSKLTGDAKESPNSPVQKPSVASDVKINASAPTYVEADTCKYAKNEKDHDLCIQWYQTKAAQDSAKWTLWTVIIGAIGTISVAISIWYSAKATRAALASVKLAEKIHAREIRPWIVPEIQFLDNLIVGSQGANVRIGITCKNTGSSVATNTIIRAFLFAGNRDNPPANRLTEEYSSIARMGCIPGRNGSFGGDSLTYAIAPDSTHKITWNISTDRDSIDKSMAHNDKRISLLIFVGSWYESVNGEKYETSAIYHIDRVVKNAINSNIIDNFTVPVDELVLYPFPNPKII